MVSDLAMAGTSLRSSPFNITLFESCSYAMSLLKTASHIGEFGKNNFIDYLATQTTNTTTIQQFRRSALLHLSTLALRNSNVSNILLKTFEHYEYPEGRGKWDIVTRHFRTEESSLPPCKFDSLNPVSRERYVYCTHLLHYFSLSQTAEISRKCNWPKINSDYNPIALNNIGSYLLSAELTDPPDPLVQKSSWAIREDWDINFRKAFCKSQNDHDYYWRQTLCNTSPSSLPPKNERTYQYWKKVIQPQIDSNGGVLCSTVRSELLARLSLQNESLRNFRNTAYTLQPMLNALLQEVANNFISSRKEAELLDKILKGANRLKELMWQLNTDFSREIWDELQDEIKLLDFNLGQTDLAGRFDDIKNTLLQAKAYAKPPEEVNDIGEEKDEL